MLILKQIKELSETAKKKIKTLINLYENLRELTKIIQSYIKKYYNLKVFKGLNLKRGDKV